MSSAENFQFRADALAYEAGEATAALRKQWRRIVDEYVTVGSVLQRAKRLMDDPEFQRLTAAQELDTAELEQVLQTLGVLCTRIGNALEENNE